MKIKIKHYGRISCFIIQSLHIFCINDSSETFNNITLQAYEAKIDVYIKNTLQEVSGDLQTWIDTALSYLKCDDQILEIGSAFGRDANYIESRGFNVYRSDAVQSFVDYLHQQGHFAQKINIITDDLSQTYHMIFANAVFLHFSQIEFSHVLNKLHNHLYDSGILVFSVKKGNGQEGSIEKLGQIRYFYYWDSSDLVNFLGHHNFVVLNQENINNWIRIIAQKRILK